MIEIKATTVRFRCQNVEMWWFQRSIKFALLVREFERDTLDVLGQLRQIPLGLCMGILSVNRRVQ